MPLTNLIVGVFHNGIGDCPHFDGSLRNLVILVFDNGIGNDACTLSALCFRGVLLYLVQIVKQY